MFEWEERSPALLFILRSTVGGEKRALRRSGDTGPRERCTDRASRWRADRLPGIGGWRNWRCPGKWWKWPDLCGFCTGMQGLAAAPITRLEHLRKQLETLKMSKGPGRVMRAIAAAFGAEPDVAFSTDDLCRAVYQREPEKRHRVAVLRALRHDPRIAFLNADRPGGPLVFYRLGHAVGYGLARLKVSAPESSDLDLRAKLQAEHGHRIAEGGAWWCLAKMQEAERTGDIERLTALNEAAERAANASIERLLRPQA